MHTADSSDPAVVSIVSERQQTIVPRIPLESQVPRSNDAVQPQAQAQQLYYENIETSTKLQALLSANPALLTRLRGIYTSTLPPSDANSTYDSNEGQDRTRSYNPRGRGRGRGRGGYRAQPERKAPWSQEGADEEALKVIARIRAREGRDGLAMTEFVRIVNESLAGSVSSETNDVDKEVDSEQHLMAVLNQASGR